MKVFFALLITISLVTATSYILSEGNSVSYSLDLSRNPNNSSTTDVTLGVTYLSHTLPGTATSVNSVVCIDTAVANYSLTGTVSGLTVMAAKWTCDAGCATVAAFSTSFEVRAGSNANYTASDFNSGGILTAFSGVTFSTRGNTTSYSNFQVAEGLTPANLASAGLPNDTQTFYYRCYSQGNDATAIDYTAALDTISTTHTNGTANVTVVGGATKMAAGVSLLAALGSLVF